MRPLLSNVWYLLRLALFVISSYALSLVGIKYFNAQDQQHQIGHGEDLDALGLKVAYADTPHYTGGGDGDTGGGSGDSGGGDSGDSGGGGGGNCCGNSEGGQTDCFSGDTKIRMANGAEKNIKDVVVGDAIIAHDAMGNLVSGKVTHTKHHKNSAVVRLNKITTTLDHKFLTSLGVFKRVRELEENDVLIGEHGEARSWTLEVLETPIDTYNIEVEKHHTYIAGGYRVHNWK